MSKPSPYKAINQWAQDDQPREKLIHKGARSLSNAELIALLITTGYRNKSAVDLAQDLLGSCSDNLNQLARISPRALMKREGIGAAKATAIVAALELGRRRKMTDSDKRFKIRSSTQAYDFMKDVLIDLDHEEFWIIILSRSNEVIERRKISQGGVSATIADNKILFKYALDAMGSSIILVHNHPSGNTKPSQEDIDMTKKVHAAGQHLDIQLLDHMIIAGQSYFSFVDEGMLE